MSFKEKIDEILKEDLTENAFKLWIGINSQVPDIWKKPTSSTGKYHKKDNGAVPSIGEHTFEMLHSAKKIISMFGAEKKSGYLDSLMLSVALHDILKYGSNGTRKHTINDHDKLIADEILGNPKIFLKIMNEDEFNNLVDCLRFHSGRWSTDSNIKNFKFSDRCSEAMFIHMLDMLSTKDCLKTPLTG
jgi:hypothetical protein